MQIACLAHPLCHFAPYRPPTMPAVAAAAPGADADSDADVAEVCPVA